MKGCFARLLAILVVALALPASASFAQDARQTALNGWNATLNQVDATLRRGDLQQAELDSLQQDVQTVLGGVAGLTESLQPALADVEAQIKTLAPREGDTAAEPPVITAERQRQQAILAGLTGLTQQADVLAVRANQLLATINERQSAAFTGALQAHDRTIFSPLLWGEVGAEAPEVAERLGGLLGAWFGVIAAHSSGSVAVLLIGALFIIGAILIFRRSFLRWIARRTAVAIAPTAAQRILAAMSIVVVQVAVPLLVLVGLGALFRAYGLMPERIEELYRGIVISVPVFSVLSGLASALLASGRPGWRIAGVADATASRLQPLVTVFAALVALMPLMDTIAAVTSASPIFAAAIGGALALFAAITVLRGTNTLTRDRTLAGADQRQGGFRWHWLTPIASVAAIAAIIANVVGYLVFARFLVVQIAWVGAILCFFYLASGFSVQLIAAIFSTDRPIGQGVTRSFGFSDRALTQTTVLVDGVARVLLFLLALVLIAAPWGFDSNDVVSELDQALHGVQIGSITITFSAIITAVVVFIAGVILARLFQAWLDKRFLPTTRMDAGLRDSITTGLGYIGVILAGVAAATYAGFNPANIAIVAGALSVGIGFGLQSIVNNFVSGLILLAERPIRTGDWIVVGSDEGLVKRIRVRATEIETFDRASIMVPNSNLISGVVKNLYFRDNTGRAMIEVGVGYNSDPEKVRDILLDCAREHPLVMADPPPHAVFTDFGDSALVFELRCFVTDVLQGTNVKSDLRFSILKRLREAGIEIPFPQRDINVRDWPKAEKAITAGESGKGPTADPGTGRIP
jgi:potassium efflux system protein